MARHALVIGASLEAPGASASVEELDVARMAEMLRGRDFEVEQLWGEAATRDGILASYGRLIERVQGPDDAAVVYFTGHGGVAIDTGGAGSARRQPKPDRFIAAADYTQSTDDDFRGISAWELSLLLERLTEKTHNVTVIMDCCHAGQMSRDSAVQVAIPRVLSKPARVDLARHYERANERLQERLGPSREPSRGPGVMGNPFAVRIVACGDWQSAYPTRDHDQRPTGAFTHELLATLAEVRNAPVSWRAVTAAVRARVLRRFSMQRPVVEGPARRGLFSIAEIDAASISGAGKGEILRLDAGRISGVSEGDVYGVTAVGATSFGAATEIARVKVEEVEALHATARVNQWAPGHRVLPADTIAWPLEQALGRRPVRVVARPGEQARLEAAIAASARLRVAAAGEGAVGELHLCGGELLVVAGDGTRLKAASPPWALSDALHQLVALAAAQALRELEGEHGLEDSEVEIEWGTIFRGMRIPRPPHGVALGLGDRIYLRLYNHATDVRVAHVFNIGLRGKITLVSKAAALGIWMNPGEEKFLGLPVDPADPTDGIDLYWPEGMPRNEPGVDTLMVIVTSQAADLQALETVAPTDARRRARGEGSPLQRLVCQLHEGGMRSAAGKDPFFVVRRSYVLHPLQVAIAGRGFAIDEDPLAMHAALRPEVWVGGATWRARPVEIRLRELAVERPIRIDSLVCTRSADRARVYQARTCRFAAGGPHDGELLWRGPVRDLLDIYLWVAPDRAGDQGLDELLATARALPEVVEARSALVISDDAAPWSLAGGASAALARIAGELLRDVATGTAGLLHTSFVAHEHYGIGRQPAGGLYRADGVAFALSITDLEVGDPAR